MVINVVPECLSQLFLKPRGKCRRKRNAKDNCFWFGLLCRNWIGGWRGKQSSTGTRTGTGTGTDSGERGDSVRSWWEFRQVVQGSQENESGWLPATVPGDVHLDLLANKKIPDPFFRDNEAKLQWIENESWEYRLNFAVTADMLARFNVDLVFDGLDTASQVYVNGDQVLNADNMFRVWRVPVNGHLHEGSNMLRVVFPSSIKAAEAAASRDSFRLKSKTQDKTYIRKAAYEYGWDWGPKFVTSGIWKPVRLEAWTKSELRISQFASVM